MRCSSYVLNAKAQSIAQADEDLIFPLSRSVLDPFAVALWLARLCAISLNEKAALGWREKCTSDEYKARGRYGIFGITILQRSRRWAQRASTSIVRLSPSLTHSFIFIFHLCYSFLGHYHFSLFYHYIAMCDMQSFCTFMHLCTHTQLQSRMSLCTKQQAKCWMNLSPSPLVPPSPWVWVIVSWGEMIAAFSTNGRPEHPLFNLQAREDVKASISSEGWCVCTFEHVCACACVHACLRVCTHT